MTEIQHAVAAPEVRGPWHSTGAVLRYIVIALTAFLTVVDLFATQAILPIAHQALWRDAGGRWASPSMPAPWAWPCPASPSAISAARSTGGRASCISLVLLAIPTALLAHAPDLTTFTLLRVIAGTVHGGGLHPDACLSRRAYTAPPIRLAPSPPTSPATSPAI